MLVIKLRDSLLFVLRAEGTSGDKHLVLSVSDTGRTGAEQQLTNQMILKLKSKVVIFQRYSPKCTRDLI